MPELPEVETIRLGLQKYLVGHKILAVEILNPKSFEGDKNQILASKIIDIRRFGKGIVIDFENNNSLAIHIKMTGQLIYRDFKTKNISIDKSKVGELPGKHTRVVFRLDSPAGRVGKNATLYFNDLRKFGWMKIVKTNEVDKLPFFKNLGPEPFKDLTQDLFIKIVSKSKISIKPLIMDQKKIGGIGNIYANDALFLARINPKRKAKSLDSEECKVLFKSIIKVMEESLKYGGSSENTYVNVLGTTGDYQRHTLVYGKKGEKCKNCGSEIERIMLGGRGTFFCPRCQK